MLMTGRNYIIDTEDKRRVVREKEIKMEAEKQIEANAQRILSRYLQAEFAPVDEKVPDVDVYNEEVKIDAAKRKAYGEMEQDEGEKTFTAKAEKSHLGVSGKAVIAFYVIIALGLLLAVVLIGMSISSASAEYAALMETKGQLLDGIAAAESEINETEDGYDAADVAAGLGFVTPSENDKSYYSSPNTRGSQTYTVETNWFDSLCDFLSGIFGTH